MTPQEGAVTRDDGFSHLAERKRVDGEVGIDDVSARKRNLRLRARAKMSYKESDEHLWGQRDMDTHPSTVAGTIADFAVATLLALFGALVDHPGAAILWILAAGISALRLYNLWLDARIKSRTLLDTNPPRRL